MERIQAERLVGLLVNTFEAAGAAPDDARYCAEHLVGANLRGHDSHGVGMASAYLRWIADGRMFPDRHAKVIHDSVATLVVDGQFGLGQVIGRETMDIAIERARQTGVVCVALRNSCHLGRIGAYGERCADAGLISMHYVNVVGHGPVVAPYGGREARTITNPYCCVIPRPDGDHVVLDIATSVVAAGKLRVAYMTGTAAPPNALMDGEGNPTTDAGAFFTDSPKGFLLPFGLHKGGGLQILCELLGGALAGNWTMQPEGNRAYGATVNNMLSIIIDPDALGHREAYENEATAMMAYLRATPPAPGFAQVQLPGDPERVTMAERGRDGVPIDQNTWRDLVTAASSVGVDASCVAGIG